MATFDDNCYDSSDESDDNRSGGAKILPLLLKVLKPCQTKDGKKKACCLASQNCNKTWAWRRDKQRTLCHAANCKSIPSALQLEAEAEILKMAGGAKIHIEHEGAVSEEDAKPNVVEIQEADMRAHKKTKIPLTQATNFVKLFKKEGKEQLKENGNEALMRFITCAGVAPRVVDSKEFCEFCSTLNTSFIPPCTTNLSEYLISREAIKILHATYTLLQKERDLTMTYDGGSIA